MKKTLPPTKRNVLKITSSVYDPLGFLVPFVLRAKALIQELWRQNFEWDEIISQSLQETWKKWLEELNQLPKIKVKRCFNIDINIVRTELHIFCDASTTAFAAVSYLKCIDVKGNMNVTFIMAKSRLAPLKVLTIPRLELQGAVLAVRMKVFLLKELDTRLDKIYFWTDSMTTLQYINNENKRFKTFVANRVAEIRENSAVSEWQHIPGDMNPADWGTRGTEIQDLIPDSLWFKGPEILYQTTEGIENPQIPDLSEEDNELKQSQVHIKTLQTKQDFIWFENYSSWSKLVAVMGWIKRFISNCKIRIKEKIL